MSAHPSSGLTAARAITTEVAVPPHLEQVWPPPGDGAAAATRPPLTALVTTHNEQDRIADCLRSLQWCDEVLVVDSFSTDATLAIAGRFPKVRVLKRTYLGAASQKNWAMDRARYDWILILDADERVTPELRREVEECLTHAVAPGAFSIPRTTFFLGRLVRFSGWQNDRVVRLFHRRAARYPNRRVHADMVTAAPPEPLSSPIVHHMVDDLAEYAARVQRYAAWGAAQLWRDGRRSGPYQVLVRPAWRFLRTYVVQLGFREGLAGLVLCALQAWGAFLKWAILWAWRRDEARGRAPALPPFDDDPETWAWPAGGSDRQSALAAPAGPARPAGEAVAEAVELG